MIVNTQLCQDSQYKKFIRGRFINVKDAELKNDVEIMQLVGITAKRIDLFFIILDKKTKSVRLKNFRGRQFSSTITDGEMVSTPSIGQDLLALGIFDELAIAIFEFSTKTDNFEKIAKIDESRYKSPTLAHIDKLYSTEIGDVLFGFSNFGKLKIWDLRDLTKITQISTKIDHIDDRSGEDNADEPQNTQDHPTPSQIDISNLLPPPLPHHDQPSPFFTMTDIDDNQNTLEGEQRPWDLNQLLGLQKQTHLITNFRKKEKDENLKNFVFFLVELFDENFVSTTLLFFEFCIEEKRISRYYKRSLLEMNSIQNPSIQGFIMAGKTFEESHFVGLRLKTTTLSPTEPKIAFLHNFCLENSTLAITPESEDLKSYEIVARNVDSIHIPSDQCGLVYVFRDDNKVLSVQIEQKDSEEAQDYVFKSKELSLLKSTPLRKYRYFFEFEFSSALIIAVSRGSIDLMYLIGGSISIEEIQRLETGIIEVVA